MALENLLTVTFEVSKDISKGLINGELIRRGGVIQVAKGPESGNIIMWLKESGLLQESLSKSAPDTIPPQLAAQLSQIQTLTSAVLGIQVLNLGFTAMGFAIINQKLKRIDKKLDLILDALIQISAELQWLDRRMDHQIMAKLFAAIQNAQRARMATDSDLAKADLAEARRILTESTTHYKILLQDCLVSKRHLQFPVLIGSYFQLYSLAEVAKIQCSIWLDELESAFEDSVEFKDQINSFREEYIAPMKKFDENIRDLIRLDRDIRKKLEEGKNMIIELVGRAEGYVSEIEFISEKKIPIKEWEKIGKDVNEPILVLIEPKNPFKPKN